MGGQHDNRHLLGKELQSLAGFLQESRIAGTDTFVDQKNIRGDRRRHRKRQAHPHPGRIGADRQIEKITKLGEVRNLVEPPAHLGASQTQIKAPKHDVLITGALGIHPEADIEQGYRRALDRDPPLIRLVDASEDAQERRLPCTVMADQTNPIATLQSEIDILQCLHDRNPIRARLGANLSACSTLYQAILDRSRRRAIDREGDRDLLQSDRCHRPYPQTQ